MKQQTHGIVGIEKYYSEKNLSSSLNNLGKLKKSTAALITRIISYSKMNQL